MVSLMVSVHKRVTENSVCFCLTKKQIERDREIQRQTDRKAEIERYSGKESEREKFVV